MDSYSMVPQHAPLERRDYSAYLRGVIDALKGDDFDPPRDSWLAIHYRDGYTHGQSKKEEMDRDFDSLAAF